MPNVENIARELLAHHLRLLEVIVAYPHDEFAGRWIRRACEQQGVPFHQGLLTKLTNVGLLEKGDSSRCGSRRYYRIVDRSLAAAVVAYAGEVV